MIFNKGDNQSHFIQLLNDEADFFIGLPSYQSIPLSVYYLYQRLQQFSLLARVGNLRQQLFQDMILTIRQTAVIRPDFFSQKGQLPVIIVSYFVLLEDDTVIFVEHFVVESVLGAEGVSEEDAGCMDGHEIFLEDFFETGFQHFEYNWVIIFGIQLGYFSEQLRRDYFFYGYLLLGFHFKHLGCDGDGFFFH